MTHLLTSAEMRAFEGAEIGSGRVNGLALMEQAGKGVVAALLERYGAFRVRPHRAAVLCGPGNNGGDGFVIARLLRARGWQVETLLLGDADTLPGDAATVAGRWRMAGAILPIADAPHAVAHADLVVDALFGTGLSRPLPESMADVIASVRARGCPVVAVDAPSGLCLDSGRVIGTLVLPADLCVTFHRAKVGHMLGDGPALCGTLVVRDIGLGPGPQTARTALAQPASVAKGAARKVGRHKYEHGHALVLSGGPGRGGAARMAARAALRIGAGLVTVGCPPAALQENAGRLDAVMLASLRGDDAIAREVRDRKIRAICIGPGFGLGERATTAVAAILGTGLPAVLDADALSAFSDDPSRLFSLLHRDCVLTPHAGEFGRLFPDLRARLDAPAALGPAWSKVDATCAAAHRAGCTVLFKGADTVIANADGRSVVNSAHYERAAPWLATAGSGDVLAGLITGLLARGFPGMAAAETAAWIHVACARRFGPGLIAEDLPDLVPAVLGDLEAEAYRAGG